MAARFAALGPGDPRQVGRYSLWARLGMGGMGQVYLAFTPGGRALAIKVVRPEHAQDEEFRRRFQREVAAAQRVRSPFTAPVVDADPTAPLPWLATAHVPGPSLRHAVTQHGPLPPSTVFRLVAGVAEGLAAVHAAGIVHRDLTPANVLLAADGPRVIDFGIAHAMHGTALTRTGVVVGTPAYMAPEQILGRPATPATDVYALGNLAVFAATGHPAFGEGNPDAVVYRIVNENPDLDDCPPEIRAIAVRCLAKDPAIRPGLAEITDYAGEHTAGVAGSWLPPAIAETLTSYNTIPYHPRTAPYTRTAPYPYRPLGRTIRRTPRRRSSGAVVAAAIAVFMFVVAGTAVGFGVNWLRGHPSHLTPPASTSTSTNPPPTTEPPANPPATTPSAPSLPAAFAGCEDGFNNPTLDLAQGRSGDSAGTLAAIYEEAANAALAAGREANDPGVRSALDGLATDYTNAAGDVLAGNNQELGQATSAIDNDLGSLNTACDQALSSWESIALGHH